MRRLARVSGAWEAVTGARSEILALNRVASLLQELAETLEAGSLPETSRWLALARLPPPWGQLTDESVRELRASGGALLPTLKRLRALAEAHLRALKEARARAAQALAQALICAALVPFFGGALYFLLPGVEERLILWLGGCALAILGAACGALWLLSMADSARWGGVRRAERPWVLAAQCAGERFLSLLRSGTPSDLAWVRACEFLELRAPGLVPYWGFSTWKDPALRARETDASLRPFLDAGEAIRKSIQLSLTEGRPCSERTEGALAALRSDLHAQVERELAMLGTRALKPLFLCVAPALLGLLGLGLYIGWESSVIGG